MPERRLQPHLAQWIVQSLTRLLATYAILQGFAIVLGGTERWQSPALATALSFPGAPASWGLILGVLGAVTLAATFRPYLRVVAWCVFGISVWCMFFAGSLFWALLKLPNTATTGVGTYTFMALAAALLAVAYKRSQP
jgi:hypothetical protein